MMRVLRHFLPLLLLLSVGTRAFAADGLPPGRLEIVLQEAKGRKVPVKDPDEGPTRGEYHKQWKRACEKIGAALTAGKGAWGFGAFSGFDCLRDDKKVGGSASEGENDARDSPWRLEILDAKKSISFSLTFKAAKGETVEVARLGLRPSLYFMSFFEDDEFTDGVSFAMLDAMPMAMHVASPDDLTVRHWRAGYSKKFKFTVPDPPEELVFYRLRWEEDNLLWRTEVVGRAKRTTITPPKKKKGKKEEDSFTLVGGAVVYEPDAAVAAALKEAPLWAHDARGPGTRTAELKKLTTDGQIALQAASANGTLLDFLKGRPLSLFGNFLETGAAGYVGLRYGFEVIPGDELLEATRIFSLLLEFRGGPLKGLRYYYDKLPITKNTVRGADGSTDIAHLEWSRHTLGFSFGFDPGFVLDRITIDPKLGMWRFDARLQVPNPDPENPGKVRTEQFYLGKTFSLALEAGAEVLSKSYTLRGWYSFDTGFSLLKSGGKVSSNRVGVDAFFTAGPSFPLFGVLFKTALLGFYVFEKVDVSLRERTDLAPNEVAILGVPYSAGYAGGGVLVTW